MKKPDWTMVRVAVVNLCRFLLAAVFVFSGFVKAVDPTGSYYKFQDYLGAFGLLAWIPDILVLMAAVILAAVEFFVGVCLAFGIRRGLSSLIVLILMLLMTPLTLYLAIANPVSDCGCFGDALVLTNWQTFGKNVVLLAAAWIVFKYRKCVIRFISYKLEWMLSLYTIVFIFVLSFYCLRHLPVLDFRPYRIGVNIQEGMSMPEGVEPSIFETVFILEKNGERREFTLENYPDSTWTFVDSRTLLKKKGYEPPIHDFSLLNADTGEDITEQVLTDEGYTFLLVAHRLEEADESRIDLINELNDYAVEHDYGFYCLTSSTDEAIEQWKDNTGAEYTFCLVDDITLKTMIRSNPGLMLIRKGTILNKWSDEDFPDEYVLTDRLEKIELGQQKIVSDSETLTRVGLWFIIPFCIVLVLDLLWVRRREKINKL